MAYDASPAEPICLPGQRTLVERTDATEARLQRESDERVARLNSYDFQDDMLAARDEEWERRGVSDWQLSQ